MKSRAVLAIDGPAGSGKTTTAREAARRLGFRYLDSGALYRAIAWGLMQRGVEASEDPRLDHLVAELSLRAEVSADQFSVYLDEQDVTPFLRGPAVSSLASRIATREPVRNRVVRWLHELADESGAVVEGRDIGTVVFPDALLKIFLVATQEVRVERRARELEQRGERVDRREVADQIEERDRRDAGRAVAPLVRAVDAVEIDTTDLDVDHQVSKVLDAWGEKVPPRIHFGYRLHQWCIGLGARLLWGLRVEGADSVPKAGGLLIVCNHKSYLDPLLAGSVLPREIYYLAKRELFEIPVLRVWVRTHNALPIDRDRFDRRAIDRALQVIRRGDPLLIFPEGTRIDHPGLGPPREGVAWIAARAQVPILPMHIEGSWARRRKWFRPGGIRIRIGEPFFIPPVPSGKAGRDRLPAVAETILGAISSLATGLESS